MESLSQYSLPLLGRTWAIGVFALVHLVFAAFALGGPIIAVFSKWRYNKTGDDRHERLAKTLTKYNVIFFSVGATLGVGLVALLTGLFPVFWTRWLNLFFWPLVAEVIMFFIEGITLYIFYYKWEKWRDKPGRHLGVGVANIIAGTGTLILINFIASAMLTPAKDLSGANPWTVLADNPTFWHLTIHRIVANISLTGFLIALVGAWWYARRAQNDQDRSFYEWVAATGTLFGLGALILIPPIGVLYNLQLQKHSPGAFYKIMTGEYRFVFNMLTFIVSTLFFLTSNYFLAKWADVRGGTTIKTRKILVAIMVVCWVWLNIPFNVAGLKIPLGRMVFKYFTLSTLMALGIFAVTRFISVRREIKWGNLRGVSLYGLILVGILATAAMNVMGSARESARRPYLVYGRMSIAEEVPLTKHPTLNDFASAQAKSALEEGYLDTLTRMKVEERFRADSIRLAEGGTADASTPAQADPQAALKAEIKRGAALVEKNGCTGCHRIQGKGETVGPDLTAIAPKLSEDKIMKYVRNPSNFNTSSGMPEYENISDADRQAIARYIKSEK